MWLLRGFAFIVIVATAVGATPPVAPETPPTPQQLAEALSDVLEPQAEPEALRLQRQRAELALVKRFGFQPDPIDPVAVRFRTSPYPLLHAAATALAEQTGGGASARRLLGPALWDESARRRLIPFVIAEMGRLVSRDLATMNEWEKLLTRRLSFYTAILEQTAVVRLMRQAEALAALDPSVAAKMIDPTDLLAVNAAGPSTAAELAELPVPAAAWATSDGEAEFRAAMRLALRSLGGARLQTADLARLGFDETSPAGGVVAAYGAVLQPFVAAAQAHADFRQGWAEAMRGELANDRKLSVDLRARTHDAAGYANLFVYMLKMTVVDPQSTRRP